MEPPIRFLLELPTSPAFVGTARMFAASLSRRFGCDQASVEDIKLAVSEACTMAMGNGRESITLTVTVDEPRIEFTIVGGARTTEEPGSRLGTELVQALFEEVEFRHGDDGLTVTFAVEATEANEAAEPQG